MVIGLDGDEASCPATSRHVEPGAGADLEHVAGERADESLAALGESLAIE